MNGKLHSVASKISRLTTIAIVGAVFLSSVVLESVSSFIISRETDSSVITEAENNAHDMASWFSSKMQMVNELANNVKYHKLTTSNSIAAEDYLAGVFNSESDAYAYSLGLENGDSYFSDRWDGKAEGYDPRTRAWYKDAVATDRIVISAPYVDAMTGGMVITISKRIEGNGRITGVVAADINVDTIVNMAMNAFDNKNEYAILTDADGTVLVHREEKYIPHVDGNGNEVFVNISDTGAAYAQSDVSVMNVSKDFDGVKRMFIQAPIKSSGWYFIIAMDYSYYRHNIYNLIIIFVLLFAVCLAVSALVSRNVISRLLKPMNEINTVADNMKQGVLSFSSSYNSNDEIGNLYSGVEQSNKNIRMYLDDIDAKLSRMADGDFTNEFQLEYKGDFRAVSESMKQIQNELKKTLKRIDVSTTCVANGSEQVAAAAQSLAAGATEQAGAVENLSLAVSEISEQINRTATGAKQTRKKAESVGAFVKNGSRQMKEMTDAMNNISSYSEEISKIIRIIEDIAFQTNILALNAAVEAARAGNAGKGFAVVADEVRNLAAKSAEAASSTTQLINGSVEAVSNGIQTAALSAESLEKIICGVDDMVELINEISDAAEIQSTSITRITDEVTCISDVVSRNTATAEECAASSEELSGNSSMLKSMISRFKL